MKKRASDLEGKLKFAEKKAVDQAESSKTELNDLRKEIDNNKDTYEKEVADLKKQKENAESNIPQV